MVHGEHEPRLQEDMDVKNGSVSMSVKGVERERYGWVCVWS